MKNGFRTASPTCLRGTVLFLCACLLMFPARGGERKRNDIIKIATVNANYRVALEAIGRRYTQMNPGVKVEVTIVARDFETWLRTRLEGGGDQVPDIFNVNYLVGYEQKGYFIWLTDYLDQVNPYTGKPWRDTLDMALVERYKFAGQIYLIPLDYIEIGVFYNKDLFKAAGVGVPETWTEWMDTCRKLQDSGVVPIAIPGNADSFWVGTMGWLFRLVGDAYLRDLFPLIASRPGDWDYDEARNGNFHYDPDDPYCDLYAVLNQERLINAVMPPEPGNDMRGIIDFQGERFRAIHQRIRELSRFFQPGYFGADDNSVLQLFYRQRAAQAFFTSANITAIIRDFKKLNPEDRFDYGIFWFPPITDDPLVQGPFRGVGGSGTSFGIYDKKDPAHTANCVDFFMYLTSPEGGKMLIEKTLEADQPLSGPSAIKGVKLPPEIAEKFDVFKGHGYERLNFRGLADEQESVFEWVTIAQEYFARRMPLDEYLAAYHASVLRAIPRLQYKFGYDLDPTTPNHVDKRSDLARNPVWKWNPFSNGIFAVFLIVAGFLLFVSYHTFRAQGTTRHLTITAYTLLLPTFLLLCTFNYYPVLSGLYHAFTEWEPGEPARWVGLRNFHTLFTDPYLWAGVINMLIMTTATLLKATVVPFLAAEMILALRSTRLKYIIRTSFLLPMVVPAMVTLLIWRLIYDPNIGMLNRLLEVVGLGGWTQSWLGEPHLALPSIIFMGFPWVGAFGLLIYMAGLMNIPASVHEAFRLESTNVLRRILAIDVPMVRGQTRLLVVLTFIGSLQDFQSVLILTNGGPGLSTMLPALRMYHAAFRFSHFGYGAALGLALFLVILLITVINFKLFKPAEEM